MDAGQGPRVGEAEGTEDGLVVDGEGKIEHKVHGQPRVRGVDLPCFVDSHGKRERAWPVFAGHYDEL